MDEYVGKLRKRLRISSDAFDDEISDLASACQKDMKSSGIYGDLKDPLYFQAVVLYEKAYFGTNEDAEKMKEAYEALKISMSLSGEYNGQKQNTEADQSDL